MSNNAHVVLTPAARQAQAQRGAAQHYDERMAAGFPDRVTPDLAAFIAQIDTAFLGTVSAHGWPYIQHRGGPRGFIKVVDERTLGFADYRGNRQYITLSNLEANDRAYLFLLEPATRQRIKIWGRAKAVEGDEAMLAKLFDKGYRARPERVILFTIEAWDVNCAQHITARYSEPEVIQATAQLRAHRETGSRKRRAARGKRLHDVIIRRGAIAPGEAQEGRFS